MTHTEDSLMELAGRFGDARFDCGLCVPGKERDAAYDRMAEGQAALRLAIREVLAERDALEHASRDAIREHLFQRERAEQAEAEVKRLRKLLREASGPMSYGHWSTDFRDKVNAAIEDRQ